MIIHFSYMPEHCIIERLQHMSSQHFTCPNMPGTHTRIPRWKVPAFIHLVDWLILHHSSIFPIRLLVPATENGLDPRLPAISVALPTQTRIESEGNS
jgi:hypothetical protein